jgi:hypothetical protein
MLKWLLCLRGITVQASTPVSVWRGRGRLKPLEHLHQLPFEQLKFGNLLLDGAQLLGHKRVQSGTHGQTLPAVEFSRQHFEIGEGEP